MKTFPLLALIGVAFLLYTRANASISSTPVPVSTVYPDALANNLPPPQPGYQWSRDLIGNWTQNPIGALTWNV